jgi:hypothetical protein
MSERRHDMPKPEEIQGILAAISKEMPGLVKGMIDAFFSPEAAADIGKAVAAFYKNLKEGGIPDEQALAMTKDYLGTLTKWSEALKGLRPEIRAGGHED